MRLTKYLTRRIYNMSKIKCVICKGEYESDEVERFDIEPVCTYCQHYIYGYVKQSKKDKQQSKVDCIEQD
jgi:hypothetical protein